MPDSTEERRQELERQKREEERKDALMRNFTLVVVTATAIINTIAIILRLIR
nr:MAG TPA: hypothetical protein [Caudoviricetes sp.]